MDVHRRLRNAYIKYPTIDVIDKIKAPLLLLHGLGDYKVPAHHSAALFERVTNTCVTAASSRGVGGRQSWFGCASPASPMYLADASGAAMAAKASRETCREPLADAASAQCMQPVEMHFFPNTSHNEAHNHPSWLTVLPFFVSRIESAAV